MWRKIVHTLTLVPDADIEQSMRVGAGRDYKRVDVLATDLQGNSWGIDVTFATQATKTNRGTVLEACRRKFKQYGVTEDMPRTVDGITIVPVAIGTLGEVNQEGVHLLTSLQRDWAAKYQLEICVSWAEASRHAGLLQAAFNQLQIEADWRIWHTCCGTLAVLPGRDGDADADPEQEEEVPASQDTPAAVMHASGSQLADTAKPECRGRRMRQKGPDNSTRGVRGEGGSPVK